MPNLGEVDMNLVRDLIRRKREREGLSLRDAADEMGISAPTLQRVEAGQLPTATVLFKLTDWLGVTVDELRKNKDEQAADTVERIEIYLRADPKLDQKTAAAIANIVREVYDGFTKVKKGK